MKLPTAPYCSGNYNQGRHACDCSTGHHIPAEACTELGAGTAPAAPGLLARLRIAHLRWQLACLVDERAHYQRLGWVDPIYLRESYAQQRRLMTRITKFQDAPPPTRHWPAFGLATAATLLLALPSAVGLVSNRTGGPL
jgi:hypothetical protein